MPKLAKPFSITRTAPMLTPNGKSQRLLWRNGKKAAHLKIHRQYYGKWCELFIAIPEKKYMSNLHLPNIENAQ